MEGIELGHEFARYSPVRRIVQELRYGWMASRATAALRPDIAIFSNVPILPLAIVSIVMKLRRIPFIFWWQDVYSEAVGAFARKRLGWPGAVLAAMVEWVERGVAKRAAAVVPITGAFTERLNAWGINQEKVSVIPNWGALGEVSPRPRNNPWSAAHELDNFRVAMYAGTLGLKHDPSVLVELARSIPDDCRIVVVSEGQGREWLEGHSGDCNKLILLDYQPYEALPDMLATADVMLAILEEDASKYSVPSKVLNYLCAGRPVLGLLPTDNSVAGMIEEAKAGVIVPPSQRFQASQVLNRLLADPAMRDSMGSRGRRFAERTFDMVRIADNFEAAINYAAGLSQSNHRPSAPHYGTCSNSVAQDGPRLGMEE